MKKHTLYTEAAYLLGLVLIAVSVVFMTKADYGVSMVVAPAYILHLWISPYWSLFTFGMAEYTLQLALILVMALVLRKFKMGYVLSFATAVLYGFILDGVMLLGQFLPMDGIWCRPVYYVIGALMGPAGVAMMFRTYLPAEAYELLVKEIAEHFRFDIHKTKTVYDLISCTVGLILSFSVFGFGKFIGVSWGTIVCALINGFVVGFFSKLYEKHFTFKDGLPWRSFFTKDRMAVH